MVQFFDNLLIGLKCRAVKASERFKDESGVSSFVATVLLIVIVVALAAIFWKSIKSWFETMWQQITTDSGNITTTE